jgi:phage shock protein A
MLKTLNTLLMGKTARAEEAMQDRFSRDLIDQKVGEADANMRAAKSQLALLIQRERTETRLLAQLDGRITDLSKRASAALASERDDLAADACTAIAEMENERAVRRDALAHNQGQVIRLRRALEGGHRRMINLRQGALRARALRREQDMQSRLGATSRAQSAAREAEDLITRVLDRDSPGEQAQILAELEASFTKGKPTERPSAGFGPKLKSSASDVMARLKSNPQLA